MDRLKVEFTLAVDGAVKIEVCKLSGDIVYGFQEVHVGRKTSISIAAADFIPGIDICKFDLDGGSFANEYLFKAPR